MAAYDDYETELTEWILRIADMEERMEHIKEPDSRAAAQVYLEDLQHHKTLLQERHMNESLAQAVNNDAGLLSSDVESHEDQDQDMKRFAALNIAALVETEDLNNVIPEKADNTCVICLDDNLDASQVALRPCGHAYCGPCIQEHYDTAFKEEYLFPPKCCDVEIVPEDVNQFLKPGTRRRFYEKKMEFLTPHKRRVYCSNGECTTFIPMHTHDLVMDEATCHKCQTVTCILCNRASHWGLECLDDEALNSLLEMGEQQGWKRCGTCGSMIELSQGCFHMICPCGHEFCYQCGEIWKTCECNHFDEAYLMDFPILEDDDIELNPHIFCPIRRWERVEGEHVCEVCFETMRRFILQCPTCEIQACHRCRYDMEM